MKTLITWIGYNEDFEIKGSNVRMKEEGFTAAIHKDIYEAYRFNRYIVLYTSDQENRIKEDIKNRMDVLKKFFSKAYPQRKIEYRDITDKKDLQNFPVIENAFRSMLNEFNPDDEIAVIAGTGPTAVAMAWYSLQIGMKGIFKLYLLQRPEYTPGGKVSSLIEIKPFISPELDNQMRQHHIGNVIPEDIYRDDAVNREYEKALAISKASEINVLLLGETGCGKDRMAEFIFRSSPLANNPYKAINCASLPDELLYSELFGHIKGAFTGASGERKGILEECAGGTLFMDEVGDITPFMQQSLLRALENWQIKKLGSNEVQQIKRVRIIAATNQNLYEKCRSGKFRFDLYYRLCTSEIELLPYRQRTQADRKKSIDHYITLLTGKWGRKLSFESAARRCIENYEFPGNFREIYNTLNGIFGLGKNKIGMDDLPTRLKRPDPELDESYEQALRRHCLKVYEKYDYKLNTTCKALQYKNSTQLKKKFEEWGILK